MRLYIHSHPGDTGQNGPIAWAPKDVQVSGLGRGSVTVCGLHVSSFWTFESLWIIEVVFFLSMSSSSGDDRSGLNTTNIGFRGEGVKVPNRADDGLWGCGACMGMKLSGDGDRGEGGCEDEQLGNDLMGRG